MKNIKKPSVSVNTDKMRENIRRTVILFIVVVFVIGGIGIYLFAIIANDDSTNTADIQGENSAITDEQIDPALIVEEDVTELKKVDIKKGSGDTVKEGDMVKIKYTGALAETGVIFDSTNGEALDIGLDQVIAGWKEGIPGMKVGGKRKLIIPSEMGYGSTGAGEKIPPNSDLVFEVEVVGIVKE